MERSSSLQRLRAALFASRLDGLITVVLLAALLAGGQALLHWLVFKAQWAVIQANSTLFAIGRYPLDQQWRLWLLSVLLAAATGVGWGWLRAFPRPD
ncbi:MAG: amino acid ABC transporter permease, partial [Vulcanococcus sp.]